MVITAAQHNKSANTPIDTASPTSTLATVKYLYLHSKCVIPILNNGPNKSAKDGIATEPRIPILTIVCTTMYVI